MCRCRWGSGRPQEKLATAGNSFRACFVLRVVVEVAASLVAGRDGAVKATAVWQDTLCRTHCADLYAWDLSCARLFFRGMSCH